MKNSFSKIVSWNQATRWCHNSDGNVVFTNGVFDILHYGHVSGLEEARSLGDFLVVGINTDRSARRLNKGHDRPMNREKDRACVVAALSAVDRVVLFDEDTPEPLIKAIRPDVLVKGGDYALDDIPGKSFVEGYGGQVVTTFYAPGYSASKYVGRLRG